MRLAALLFSLFLARPSLAATVVFRDANVISMTSQNVAEKQTVVVTDGRIASVGTNDLPLPDGATVIDASGRYLMPGLADMHGHLPPPGSPAGLLDDVLFLYLANGVTTLRSMQGYDGHLNLREWQKKGEIVAPNLYVAGPAFSGQSIASPQEAAEKVRLQKREGWDLVKVHSGLTREEYDAVAKTAREVGIRFGGHVSDTVGLLHAIESGHETFDHLDGYLEFLGGDKKVIDAKKLARLVKRSKAANVWIVPTSALWEVLFNAVPLATLQAYRELKYVPASSAAAWSKMYEARAADLTEQRSKNITQNRRRVLKALYAGGVKILAGSDSPQQFSVPGFSLHRELLAMREAGLSPYAVLESATVNAGRYFPKPEAFGTIEVGKRADLLLLAASPLDDIANSAKIEGVMVRGRWFSRADLDAKLRKIADKYRRR